MAAGILLSRLAGFVRQRVFAHYFGASASADVFTTAIRLPNVLQNLLGEGVLSASFIPVYAELLEEGREEEAGRVAGAIFALLLALAGALAILGMLAAPVLVAVLTPGFDGFRYELTVRLVRIIFPMAGVLVLSAWSLGVLNSHRRFFLSYVAPVAWNAAMIATMVALGGRLARPQLAYALAWGTLAGGILQFLVQVPGVLRAEPRLAIRWNTGLAGVRTAVRNAGPAILGRGVVQVSGYVDVFLASFLVTGALAALGYAQLFYALPVSLFGMSVAAAELPELARQRTGEREAIRLRVNAGLDRVAFYVLATVVAYFAVGDHVIAALYQTGDFTRNETVWVWAVLAGYTIGLFASTASRLFSSAYYALQDTATPARYAAARVAISAALGVLLMLQFESVEVAGRTIGGWSFGVGAAPTVGGHPLGVAGLSAAAGLAAWGEWFLLRRTLSRRIGVVRPDPAGLVRMLAAALAAALAARGASLVLPAFSVFLRSLLVLGVFGVVYLGAAYALGLQEARSLLGRFFRRGPTS
ncbi:MAG TPA: murein biosynthesis integral membrane protein MurJ [Longimicrobiales bacterium]|nr:murein biosynthesis integral membrane protein MurJ [Longimicrobiales bacterium]